VAGKGKTRSETSVPEGVVVVKKYANRRLYNTATSSYVTLDDLSNMVKEGTDFVVFDAKSDNDITRSVLTQIIFEQEGRGQNLLPINFLRRLIRYYGDSMQSFVPGYLEASMEAFSRSQDDIRAKFSSPWTATTPGTDATPGTGSDAMEAFEGQARQNMAMFEQAMKMMGSFTPEGAANQGSTAAEPATPAPAPAAPQSAKQKPTSQDETLDELRQQMAMMQQRLDKIQDDA